MLDRYKSDNIKKINEFCYILDDDHKKLFDTHQIHLIFDAFENQGFEIRMVGGAVRDILMGKHPKDFDFATDAKPEQIEQICSKNGIHCIPTGLKHGTLTIVINKRQYEVTTLRVDKFTDGRHAIVEYITDWKLDAERRDLTVNAMSISSSGKLYDYFDGLTDLQNQKIKFVNDPRLRINEDFLRILRYFRFYQKIAHKDIDYYSFDHNVLEVIKDLSPNLVKIARERIWMELSQIITGKYSPGILKLMHELEVLKYCANYLDNQFDHSRFLNSHHNATNREHCHEFHKIMPAALLAAFFEDVTTADKVCKNLKLSNIEILTCLFIMRNRDCLRGNNDLDMYKKMLVLNYKSPRLDYFKDLVTQLMLYNGESNENVIEFRNWDMPEFPLRGNDVENLCEKKKMSILLGILKEKWMDSNYTLEKKDLIEICKNINL